MASRPRMKWYDWIAIALLIIGGLNWLLVGAANFDLVEWLFGFRSPAAITTYILVGVAAIYSFIVLPLKALMSLGE